jgi:hypothetical protein
MSLFDNLVLKYAEPQWHGVDGVCSETNSLMESVMELKHSKKRLEEQNKELQTQLHTSEDSYALLQRDYDKMCLKLSR